MNDYLLVVLLGLFGVAKFGSIIFVIGAIITAANNININPIRAPINLILRFLVSVPPLNLNIKIISLISNFFHVTRSLYPKVFC